MLELPDSWTWDFWFADTGEAFHLFFLFASRALGEESRRHRRASIGHAVSTDLTNWERVADALVRSDAPGPDDVATWTGSVIQDAYGQWQMFFTGCSDSPVHSAQRVMRASSSDLMTWNKASTVVASADPRWYATGLDGPDEPFRDPWVFRESDVWHMLITARGRTGDHTDNGIIGHATSFDLVNWDVQPPLSSVGHGFGQLEVPQVLEFEGRWLLVFSCLRNELAESRRREGATGGVWVAEAVSPLGPFDLDGARQITDDSLYAGRAVKDREGVWQFLAFDNYRGGGFVGRLVDPVPLSTVLARTTSGVGVRGQSPSHRYPFVI